VNIQKKVLVLVLLAILLAVLPMAIAGEGVVSVDVTECIPQPPMAAVWGRADGFPEGETVGAYLIRAGKDRISDPFKVSSGGEVFAWGEVWQGEQFGNVYTFNLLADSCEAPGMRPSAINVVEVRVGAVVYGYLIWVPGRYLIRFDLSQPTVLQVVVSKLIGIVYPPATR